MSSTIETLRKYEQNAKLDADRARSDGPFLVAMYYDGKADAYGVAIDMLEGDERREDVTVGKRWTR